MPLPIGHSAIGFATHSLISRDNSRFNKWQAAIFIVLLSNLPDIDVLFGLILQNNGSAFHRGPTHSILFALIVGFVASNSWRIWSLIPRMRFKTCFLLIFSHVAADYFLTNSPVSFYWPFEVNWLSDSTGWGNILHTVIFDAVEDAGILVICTGIIMLATIFRRFYTLRITQLLATTSMRRQTLPKSEQQSLDN
jgi:membrane-bound metal-dependent hydrolase YbcI (DUF457 family)